MTPPRPDFHPLQAEEIARAFQTEGVELLESFREEYEKRHAPPLRSAAELAGGPAGRPSAPC